MDGEDVEAGDSPWQVMPGASMGRLVVLRREQQDVELKNNKMLDLVTVNHNQRKAGCDMLTNMRTARYRTREETDVESVVTTGNESPMKYRQDTEPKTMRENRVHARNAKNQDHPSIW